MAEVPDVTADGAPETPANQMKEKRGQRNKTILGLVIGGAGLAAFFLFRSKNSSSSATPATPGIDPTTGMPYTGGPQSGGASDGTFSAGETALMSQLQQYNAEDLANQSAQNTALANIALQNQATGLEAIGIAKQNQAIGTMLATNGFHNTNTPTSASGAPPPTVAGWGYGGRHTKP